LVQWAELDEALAEVHLAQSLDPISCIIARDVAVLFLVQTRLRGGVGAMRQHDRIEPAISRRVLAAGILQAHLA
jgi:hypothetical protein